MTTYCENTDLYLDNGQSVDAYMLSTLTAGEITTRKDAARTRAYNHINDVYLRGRTAIPATHITGLEQIEVDLVVADILFGAYTGGISNVSEWAEGYKKRAEDSLKNIRFDASVDSATADGQNTGDGTVAITVNSDFAKNEKWILRAQSTVTKFSIHGSLHDYLPNDVVVGTQYPTKDITTGLGDYGVKRARIRYEEYPITLLITVGAIDFVKDDKFTFNTYAASYYRQNIGSISRG
jgi:hypothetical protein